MVYQLLYKDQLVYDIDFWVNENKKNEWALELHSIGFIENCLDLIEDLLKKKDFNKEEFRKDFEKISELRGWLWEEHDNSLVSCKDAEKRFSNLLPELEKIINTVAGKYNLDVHVD